MVDHISLPLTKLITMGKFDTLDRGNLGRSSRDEDERRCRQTSEAGKDGEKSDVADNPSASAGGSAMSQESGERAAGGNDSDGDSSKLRKRPHLSYKKFPIMAPLGIGEKRNPLVKKLLSDPNSNMRRYFEMRKKGKYKEHKSSKTEQKSSTSEVIQSSDVFGGEVSSKAESSVEQKGERVAAESSHPEFVKEVGVQKTKSRRNEGGKMKDDSSDTKKNPQSILETPEPKYHVGTKRTLKPGSTTIKKTITQEPTETKDIPQKSSPKCPSSSMKEISDDSVLIDVKDNQTPRSATESLKKGSRTRKSKEKSDESKGSRNKKVDPIVQKKKTEEIIKPSGSYHKKGKQPSTPNYRDKAGNDTFPVQASAAVVQKPRHSAEKHSYPRPQIRPCLLMKTADNSENNEDSSDESSDSQGKRSSSDDDDNDSEGPENTSAPVDYSQPSTSSGTSSKQALNDTEEALLREEKRRRLEALFRVTEKAIAEVSSPSTARAAPREQEQDPPQEKRRRLITPSQILKGKEQMAEKSLQRKKSHHKHGKERSCLEHKVKLVTPSQILKGKKRSEEEKTERIESKKSAEGKVKGPFQSDEEDVEIPSESAGEGEEDFKKRRRDKKKSRKRSESKERPHKNKKGKKRDKKPKETDKHEEAKNDEGSADEMSAEFSFRQKKAKVKRRDSGDSKKERRGGAKEFRGIPGSQLTGNPIVNKPAKSYQKKKVQDNAHLADHDLIDDRLTIRKL